MTVIRPSLHNPVDSGGVRRKPASEGRPLATNIRPPVKILYRLDEAWHALGIGRSKGFQLLADGRLRSCKIDGRRLIHRDELERFAASLAEQQS